MRAAVIERPYLIKYMEDAQMPEIKKENEVLIKVGVTGICGSEIHAYHGTHPFRIPPVISGHELAGTVVKVGKSVTKIDNGDRVTVEPHYGCGSCRNCAEGHYNICVSKKVLGTPEWPGSFGEYIVVPERTVIKLPDNVTFEQGALIEPLAVGVHAVRKAKVGLGDSVAIMGAGPIGLSLLLAAKAAGAAKIFMSDISEYNLEIAKKLGCTFVMNPMKINITDFVSSKTDKEGVDIVFTAIGVESVLNDSFKIAKRGGKISQIAIFGKNPQTEVSYVQSKELDIIGSNMYTRYDFEIAANAIAANMFDTSLFISKIIPIEDITQGIETV
jgi:L-iditol 2-dehydrogenase